MLDQCLVQSMTKSVNNQLQPFKYEGFSKVFQYILKTYH